MKSLFNATDNKEMIDRIQKLNIRRMGYFDV